MKKWIVISLLLAVGLVAFPRYSYAESVNSGDSIIDKVSDWFATIGKSPEDHDVIVAQRRAERAAKHFGDAMKSESEEAGKKVKKMGKKMGEMFDNN